MGGGERGRSRLTGRRRDDERGNKGEREEQEKERGGRQNHCDSEFSLTSVIGWSALRLILLGVQGERVSSCLFEEDNDKLSCWCQKYNITKHFLSNYYTLDSANFSLGSLRWPKFTSNLLPHVGSPPAPPCEEAGPQNSAREEGYGEGEPR